MDKQWKVVPVEPTPQMIDSASAFCDSRYHLHHIYTHMLESAPQPPSASDEREIVQCNCPGGTKSAGLHAPNCPVRLRDAVLIDPYDGGRWLAPSPGVDAAERGDTHAFKNFHRSLCERFEYCHDERDWRRDQVSLIEHIAKRCSPSPAASADEWMAEAEKLMARIAWARKADDMISAHRALLAHLKARP